MAIGPEVTQQSIKVLDTIAEKFGHRFHYDYCLLGLLQWRKPAPASGRNHRDLPDSDAILFGAVGHPKYDNDPAAKVKPEQGLMRLRKSLQLFANIGRLLPTRHCTICRRSRLNYWSRWILLFTGN